MVEGVNKENTPLGSGGKTGKEETTAIVQVYLF
jgi:hypothetical protein